MFLSAIPAALVLAFVTYSAEGQTAPSSPVPGVAYISSQRLLNEVAEARTELAKVQALQAQKNSELRAKQQEIEATRRQIAAAADAGARNTLMKQEDEQRQELQRLAQQAQAELQKLQREVQAGLQVQVKKATEELSREQNIRLVLNADTTVIWAAPGMDVTNQLIDKLNAQSAQSTASTQQRH
jgi:Skp family chaperone for outer membrane proteins